MLTLSEIVFTYIDSDGSVIRLVSRVIEVNVLKVYMVRANTTKDAIESMIYKLPYCMNLALEPVLRGLTFPDLIFIREPPLTS